MTVLAPPRRWWHSSLIAACQGRAIAWLVVLDAMQRAGQPLTEHQRDLYERSEATMRRALDRLGLPYEPPAPPVAAQPLPQGA